MGEDAPVADDEATGVDQEVRRAVEAILMVAVDPVPANLLAQLLEVSTASIEEVCANLADEFWSLGALLRPGTMCNNHTKCFPARDADAAIARHVENSAAAAAAAAATAADGGELAALHKDAGGRARVAAAMAARCCNRLGREWKRYPKYVEYSEYTLARKLRAAHQAPGVLCVRAVGCALHRAYCSRYVTVGLDPCHNA